jgi:hypothetical protein
MTNLKNLITGGFVILGILAWIVAQTIFGITETRVLFAILTVIGVLVPQTLIGVFDIEKHLG